MFVLTGVFSFLLAQFSTGVSPYETSIPSSYQSLTSADYFNPDEYEVCPGDQIWLSFPGGVPFSGSQEPVSTIVLPVELDGSLSVPGLPPITTTGMTLRDLQHTIDQVIRSSYGRLSVSTGLARSASFQIPVTGQVSLPGIVTVNGLTRLSEVVDLAGGISASGAMSAVLVLSQYGDSTSYDLYGFLVDGDMNQNPLMRRNTRVHVFPSEASITVEGALSISEMSRQILEYIPGETAAEAVMRAGGASNGASVDRCAVYRSAGESYTEVIPFSLTAENRSVHLEPGDRVVVPFLELNINIVGEVILQQPVPYSPGMNVN